MRADSTDTFDEVYILYVCACFTCFFDTPVVVTKSHIQIDNLFPVEGHNETFRLFQGRVLRADGNLDVSHNDP